MKKQLDAVRGNRILLRLLEPRDLSLTLGWRNQDHIRRWFLNPNIISRQDHFSWYASYVQKDNDFLFLIEERHCLRRPVGQIGVYNIDWTSKSATIGRLLIGDPEARGRGIAKEASRLLLYCAVDSLGLTFFSLEVLKENHKAIRLYRSLGFQCVDEADSWFHMQLRLKTESFDSPV